MPSIECFKNDLKRLQTVKNRKKRRQNDLKRFMIVLNRFKF